MSLKPPEHYTKGGRLLCGHSARCASRRPWRCGSTVLTPYITGPLSDPRDVYVEALGGGRVGTFNMRSASAAAIARRLLTELGPGVEEGVLRRCVGKKHTGCMA